MTTESKDFEAQLDKFQTLIGKCSEYCIHYRHDDECGMYCDHPNACEWEEYSLERGFGEETLCPLWKGAIGYCKEHDTLYIEVDNVGCVDCWDKYYTKWMKEQEDE